MTEFCGHRCVTATINSKTIYNNIQQTSKGFGYNKKCTKSNEKSRNTQLSKCFYHIIKHKRVEKYYKVIHRIEL